MLAGIFLYLSLRGLDWAVFLHTLRTANYAYIPFVFAWGSLTAWIRAVRWRIPLSVEKSIPAKNVFWANMAGYLGNSILPARAGELIRAIYIGRENAIPISFALATGLVERFVDLIALVIIGSITLATTDITSPQIDAALTVTAVVAIVGLAVILLLPYFGNKLIDYVSSLSRSSSSVKTRIESLARQFLQGMRALNHPVRAGTFILLTCIVWLMDGVGTVLLSYSLHINLSLGHSLLLLAGLGLSSAIPSTPGYVGVYQFIALIILQPLGVPQAGALALVILMQAMNFLVVAFWGWLALIRASVLFGKRRATEL